MARFIPLPMAMAIPFYIGPYFAIDMCLGSFILFVWQKTNKEKADAFAPAVASGLICGDGLWTLPQSVLALAKYAHGSEARDTPKGISIRREPEAMTQMPGLMGGRKEAQGQNRVLGIDKDGGNHLHLHGMHHHDHRHPMDNKDELDPQTKVFFMMEDFDKGNEMPVYFANRDLYASPPFLPKQMADSIPFSYKHLPLLLEMFSIPKNSPQAQAMRDTLTECESAPIRGETKMCATSFESMFDFVRAIFGNRSQLQILMTAHHQEQTLEVPLN